MRDTKTLPSEFDLSQEIRTMQRLVQRLLMIPKSRLRLDQKLRLMDALGETCYQLASLQSLQARFSPDLQSKINRQVNDVIDEITADWSRLGEEAEQSLDSSVEASLP